MGLGQGWTCTFANDLDERKNATYQRNWGSEVLDGRDVAKLQSSDLPGQADLAWASFPCQDLSLAGNGAGLKGDRSGTFWPFWRLMKALVAEDRAPKIVVLENVPGTLTSHNGSDFTAICEALDAIGYRSGALVINASLFVPQSRPRLFVIAVREDLTPPSSLVGSGPQEPWHVRALTTAFERLPHTLKDAWVWWSPLVPDRAATRLGDLIEERPDSVDWHSETETQKLLSMMSDVNLAKVEKAQTSGRRMVGTVYKRTRRDSRGQRVQRAEVRFDDVAGCLRTPAGGSSRQVILVVEGTSIRSRLISSRETARLMGLPDTYILPDRYNEAYHLTGDGVVVPVVRHLTANIFEPLILHPASESQAA